MAISAFHFDPQTLDPENRSDGISAFLKVRNGARFLRAGLESCMDIFDEMVAVYHQCSDETPQILHELAERHPQWLKVYEYPYEVVPPGTPQHAREGAESPHTIAALCNYALSKTTRRILFTHDADQIYIRPNLARVAAAVRRLRSDFFVKISGVNLARLPDGGLGVSSRNPICGVGDCGFFPSAKHRYFVHDPRHESFSRDALPRHLHHYEGIVFWHMKFLEKHYGLREYQYRFEGNLNELHRQVSRIEKELDVVPLDEFIRRFSGAGSPFNDWVRYSLFRNRWTRLPVWHCARFVSRVPGFNRVCPMYANLSITLEKSLCTATLPEVVSMS